MLLSPRDAAPRDLHSFPTRRSSDLTARAGGATDLAQRLDRADLAARRLDRHERGVRADRGRHGFGIDPAQFVDRKSTRLNSSHANISYAVFCLKKKKKKKPLKYEHI